MKVISCTTPTSNDNPAPIIREPTVALINSSSNSRAALPSLAEIVFGPYHQDILEAQLKERNNLLQQQECQLQHYKKGLRHKNMLLLKLFVRLHQLENQLQQQDAQLQQKCQKCFSNDYKPICSKAPHHVFEERLMVGQKYNDFN